MWWISYEIGSGLMYEEKCLRVKFKWIILMFIAISIWINQYQK